jgi:hypothetical protein
VSQDQHAATAQVATAVVPGAERVGYVPTRTNRVRDGLAVALLVVALLLPWSIVFGVGVPGSNGLLFVPVAAVTLFAVVAALAPHVGPLRLTAPQPNLGRTIRIRFLLSIPYVLCVLGFIGFHVVETIRFGGTGAVPPGAGPGIWLGAAGALLAAQPPITSITIEDNGFRRWYAAVRLIGVASIVLAAWAVVFNLFWRLRYLFVTTGTIAGHDVAVVVTTLLYGGVAMVALLIGSAWLLQKTAAARLATTALGVSAGIAGVLVWVLSVGRDVDAFHGIAENTSTAAVGYEGYLAWAAAAAIVAPTTLYAVFLVKPPTMAVYRGAALKCLTLIAFWTFAAAGLRVTDFLIALTLDLPRSLYDSFALMAFNVVTGCIAVWLQRQLAKGGLSSVVIAAFSGSLFVFTAAQLVIGVALAPRYADPTPRSPDAIYGNDLAQQITSMFDVVICVLSLAILVAVVVTGPLAGYLTRRRAPRETAPAAVELPTAVVPRPQQATMPKIVRLKQDSTTVLAPHTQAVPTSEVPVATTALRIQRRPESTSSHATPDGPTVPAKRPFAAGAPSESPASGPVPEVRDPGERRD